MELSYDYKSEQSATKRAKTVFSLLASPNRIDILKILNSKGPLTYSELKSYAGFKSKKESGKFAYHLRKLLRQSFIALNRGEKKYTITNLGRVVLNLIKEIEERSIIESGKISIRMLDRLQEFNTHKITQLLIRDAGIPPDIAGKVVDELESKVFKLDISYLTYPIIIEMICNILLEYGYEEYRTRLGRIGISMFELAKLLEENNINTLVNDISSNILTEYMLFSYLPKDIVDEHIKGNIHIAHLNLRSIIPDTIFIDLNCIEKYRDPYSLIELVEGLTRSISKEIVLKNVRFDNLSIKEISKLFSLLSSKSKTLVSLRVDNRDVVEGYKDYLANGCKGRIGLITDYIDDTILEVVDNGGTIAISKDDRSILGIKCYNNPVDIIIHSISINLPRLAYESNKDETFFRAKLVTKIEPTIDALKLKAEISRRFINDNLISNIIERSNKFRFLINLIDPYTAITNILDHDEPFDLIYKTIDTVNNILEEKSDKIGLSILTDESIRRFLALDLESYGKINVKSYRDGIIIDRLGIVDKYNAIDKIIHGATVYLDTKALNEKIDNVYNKLQYFTLIDNYNLNL